MKRKYLIVMVVEVDDAGLDDASLDASPMTVIDRQNAVATYIGCQFSGLETGDRVIDLRCYQIGECLGYTDDRHGPIRGFGPIAWCETCGAFRVNQPGRDMWILPEIRIDKENES